MTRPGDPKSYPAPSQQFRYRVDERDRIQFVDSHWLEFARQNSATTLDEATVLEKSLWDFISGRETRHLYQILFARVRNDGKPACVPFRCDSPDRRRYMELTVTPLSDQRLEISVALHREEPRGTVALLDPKAARSEEFVTLCSWCKRVQAPGGDWVEIETAVRDLSLFSEATLPQISHGICEPCASADVLAE